MSDRHHQNRLSIGFIAGIIAAIVITASLAAWWAFRSLTISDRPLLPATDQTVPPSTQKGIPQVYWLNTNGDRIQLLATSLNQKKSTEQNQSLKTALEKLFAGPSGSNYTTTIPLKTKLLGFKVAKDGIHLNLSEDFTTGGGSTSMTGRLAQVLYTATSVNPKTQVWLNVEGKPLDVLGGEGLEIQQPMTRQWFEENFEL